MRASAVGTLRVLMLWRCLRQENHNRRALGILHGTAISAAFAVCLRRNRVRCLVSIASVQLITSAAPNCLDCGQFVFSHAWLVVFTNILSRAVWCGLRRYMDGC